MNSIFNPEFVDVLYPRPPQYRQSLISDAKATNYGVVRLELIEKLYEVMYDQRREIGSDETKWPHRILGGRRVVGVEETSDGLRLRVRQAPKGDVALEADGLVDVETKESAKAVESARGDDEVLDVDLIIAATGYRRNAHVEMLKDAWHLLPQNKEDNQERADQWAVRDVTKTCRVMEVSRDYRVQFQPGVVAPGSGVWLQGCCEGTHGVSAIFSISPFYELQTQYSNLETLTAERHPPFGVGNEIWGDGQVYLRNKGGERRESTLVDRDTLVSDGRKSIDMAA